MHGRHVQPHTAQSFYTKGHNGKYMYNPPNMILMKKLKVIIFTFACIISGVLFTMNCPNGTNLTVSLFKIYRENA